MNTAAKLFAIGLFGTGSLLAVTPPYRQLRAEEPPRASESPTIASRAVDDLAVDESNVGNSDSKAERKVTRKPAAKRQTKESPTASATMRKSPAGRLPRYYASIVDASQRAAIYQIQASMAAKISELEEQLEALRQAEQQQIEQLLSDAQRQQLEALRAERAATRASAIPAKLPAEDSDSARDAATDAADDTAET